MTTADPVAVDTAGPLPLPGIAFQQPAVALEPAGAVWFLEEGEADVFAVAAMGANAGSRLFLGRLPAGSLLVGIDAFMQELIAVPAAGARLETVADPLEEIEADALLAGMEAWSSMLVCGLAAILWHPDRVHRPGRCGTAVDLAESQLVMVQEAGLWCAVPAPGALLLEQEMVQGIMPLPARAWLKAAGPLRIVFGRRPLPRDLPAALAGIQALTAACGEMLMGARGLAEADEAGRLSLRGARETEEGGRFVHLAGRLLDHARKPPGTADGGHHDPLFAAMSAVAARNNPRLRLRRPTLLRERDLDVQPTMEEIARASGQHMRPVTLTEGWWRRPLGPLVGATLDGRPVALLPKGRGYELVDGEGAGKAAARKRKPVRVTPQVAAGLSASAWTMVEPLPDRPQTVGSLMRFVRTPPTFWLLTLAVAALGALLGLAMPFGMKFAFSSLVPARDHGGLLELGILLGCVAAVTLVIQLVGEVTRQSMQTMREAGLHAGLWDRVLRLPMPVLRAHSAGDMAARVGLAMALPLAAQGFLVAGIGTGAVLAASVFAMASFHGGGAVAAVLALAVQLGLAVLSAVLRARVYKLGEALNGQADSLAMQFLTGIAKLRLAAAEHWALTHWAERFIGMREKRMEVQEIEGRMAAVNAALPVLAMAALFLVFHAAGTDSASIVAMMTAYMIANGAAAALGDGFGAFYQLHAARAFADPVLHCAPEPTLGRIDPGRLSGRIAVSGLYFTYAQAETPIFANLHLTIAAGEYVAVLGRSGCGKSTLVRLLLGLERPRVGSVTYDGNDLSSLDLGLLRRRIGTVLQGAQLPPGALIDVVRGLSEATEAEIWDALAAAAIADEIRAMPLGVRTPIADASRTLSGGQVQRLLLARALVTKPDVLILDEATSALDNATQAATIRTLSSLDCTRIVIAHRLETIRGADRILILDGGRVAHAGSFADLQARGLLGT
ncbi:ATP-binding cassette domain-containing protein [Azospirillum sp. YIM B02556]|uniref:ATP-binding cassette domain-containing protein n=1 Tax=Azospirillum endophyticum TaxID=2800326 RepID=A0ABS1FFT6_9PROT|nr:ATP-binding cassette domain-containing protein [Azospirillum endophyticum]MBK1842302.1 ATP-binding cassette domain-containing protein [Azospirillum endophyticum]